VNKDKDWESFVSQIKPLKKTSEPIERKARDIIIHEREDVLPKCRKQNIEQLTKSEIKRLSSGYYKIEMRLDTHGMYQDEAQEYIFNQIKKAYARGIKRILLVTGKGKINSPSVIKENLKDWLENSEIISIITGFSPASIKDGDAGAFYITLKNNPAFK